MARQVSSGLTAHLSIRLEKQEYAKVKEQADIASLSMSEYGRRRILDKQIPFGSDSRVLGELLRLHYSLKSIAKNTGVNSPETAGVLREVTDYVKLLFKEQKRANKKRV